METIAWLVTVNGFTFTATAEVATQDEFNRFLETLNAIGEVQHPPEPPIEEIIERMARLHPIPDYDLDDDE